MNYSYFCPNCNFEKDDWHSINESPEIKCDKCGTVMKHKITGGSGFKLIGYGWTTTGSKDGTQGKGKHVHEDTVAIPAIMGGAVSDELKRSADKITVTKK